MCEGEQVSRRVIRLEIPVFPDRRMFRVHDATVDPDAPGGPLAPTGALISANREQMWVASLQEHIGVRVFLEEWDTAPPPFGDGWEDEAKAVVYLRGALSIDMGSAGRAVEGLRLVGGVGDYVIRVHARNRREVMRLYSELFERGIDPLGDEFQQARRALEGHEQYLLQLWRES
ncbi:MAG TPA: hypothetical protein DHU96_30365 [Actinobacteria bacterium]|nr:hypothetical protein [Actinomycetota bacterium]